MDRELLTCLVPTHNRPPFLRRLLQFYSQISPGFTIVVVDSSDAAAAEENVAAIQSSQSKLKIQYLHVHSSFYDKCVFGLRLVRTPFVVFCADDDVVFPDMAWRCVEFLGREPGYSSAMGRIAIMNTHQASWYRRCKVLKGYSIDDERPFDRCRKIAVDWFSIFYGVYRTEILLDSFQITASNTDCSGDYHLPERLLAHMNVLRGRIKVFPQISSLMEMHHTNAGSRSRTLDQLQAVQLFHRFRACLVHQIEQVGVERVEVERFVDDAYGYFCDPVFANRELKSTVEKLYQRFRSVMVQVLSSIDMAHSSRRRYVRASDLAGCETIWRAAVQLIGDFPNGIPIEQFNLKRSA